MSEAFAQLGPEIWQSFSEPLVTFLLPLPEALEILPDHPVAQMHKVDRDLYRVLEGEGLEDGTGYGVQRDKDGRGHLDLSRVRVQTASVLFRRIPVSLSAQSGIDAALAAAAVAQPARPAEGGSDQLTESAAVGGAEPVWHQLFGRWWLALDRLQRDKIELASD